VTVKLEEVQCVCWRVDQVSLVEGDHIS